MKSGLEGRNNRESIRRQHAKNDWSLNEVRPGRPEQSEIPFRIHEIRQQVSMKSGLEGRNNPDRFWTWSHAF